MARLDKLLAQSGLYSRSEARSLVRAGRVAAAGEVLRRPEANVPDGAVITVDGAEINCSEFRYCYDGQARRCAERNGRQEPEHCAGAVAQRAACARTVPGRPAG